MTTGDDPSVRVGNDERQAAIAVLGEQWKAGRLDPAEHERRTTAAYSATTRGDLDALFTDLPVGWAGAPAASQPPTTTFSAVSTRDSTMGDRVSTSPENSGGLVPERSWVSQHRDAIMGITPFVALALFFLTESWLFFLLIPAMGAFLYAGGDWSSNTARRRERDERRRIERGE